MARENWGSIRRLKSGRYQARARGSDGRLHPAKTPNGRPLTFPTKGEARAWLADRHSEANRGQTYSPTPRQPAALRFGEYVDRQWWPNQRLAPRTADHYRRMLDKHILPTFADVPLPDITSAMIRAWFGALLHGRPTYRAQVYSLLRTVLNAAVADESITRNPCVIRGAGQAETAHDVPPATLAELAQMIAATPEPYRLMLLLAAWCGPRHGELAELRRKDINPDAGTLEIRRGVVFLPGGRREVRGPKTRAGKRTVAMPGWLAAAAAAHLATFVPDDPDALLFPDRDGQQMRPSTQQHFWYPARKAAARPDLHFHDLRHTAASLAAATGATTRELMARMGHRTASMAVRYTWAAQERDRAIAEALPALPVATDDAETPKRPKKRRKNKRGDEAA